jgi:hypothetical protein
MTPCDDSEVCEENVLPKHDRQDQQQPFFKIMLFVPSASLSLVARGLLACLLVFMMQRLGFLLSNQIIMDISADFASVVTVRKATPGFQLQS